MTHRRWIAKKIQVLVEELFGYRMYWYRGRTHGHQDFADIKRVGYRINTIFDVGANIGECAFRFMAAFPQARVSCFEPVRETFEQLAANMSGTQAQCYRLALGSTPGHSTIYVGPCSQTNSLIPPKGISAQERVEVSTIDLFAAAHQIERIDLLKIDTEGFDLEVVKGAEGMLSSGRIAFVLTEAGFNPGNKKHVPFDDLRDALGQKGFNVFGFYDQYLERKDQRRLRRANVLFFREPSQPDS